MTHRLSSLPSLDDVLDEYALDAPSPDRLPEWIVAYPLYERELRALTEAWNTPAASAPSGGLLSRGQALLTADVLDRFASLDLDPADLALTPPGEPAADPAAAEAPALNSPAAVDALLQAAGRTVTAVRSALGLSRAMWGKLRSGMLSTETPGSRQAFERLVDGLAQVLDRPRVTVVQAFPRQASLPSGYALSETRPEASQVDLAEALRADAALSDATRQFYLTGEGSPPYRTETP